MRPYESCNTTRCCCCFQSFDKTNLLLLRQSQVLFLQIKIVTLNEFLLYKKKKKWTIWVSIPVPPARIAGALPFELNPPENIIIHWAHYLFSDWPKAYSEFSKSAPVRSSSCRLYNSFIHLFCLFAFLLNALSLNVQSRTLKVTGNHVIYDRGAWFLRVIMSSSRALCCLPLVKKQKHDLHFFFVQCIITQILDSVFVISRIIKVLVRVVSLSLRLRLITPTSTLIILDITKTSSNDCLKSHYWEPIRLQGSTLIFKWRFPLETYEWNNCVLVDLEIYTIDITVSSIIICGE